MKKCCLVLIVLFACSGCGIIVSNIITNHRLNIKLSKVAEVIRILKRSTAGSAC